MKHIRRSVTTAIIGSALLLTPSVAMAAPVEPAGTENVDSYISQLVEMNPGVSYGEFEDAIASEAIKSGRSELDVAKKALDELNAALAESGAATRLGANADRNPGKANQAGDVFYSPTSSLDVTHGHSGIYSTTTMVVEAPGPGQNSANHSYTNVKVAPGSLKQSVSTTQANRNAAVEMAKTLTGREYNLNFLFNKTARGAMNCSQLVWVAYIDGVGIDLDDDDQSTAVFPYEIRDSKWTVTYGTVA